MYSAINGLGYSPGIEEKQIEGSQGSDKGAIPEPIYSSLTTASASGKFLLVDFYAEWCIACSALEEETLQNIAVKDALENYLFLKLDTDLHEHAASFYDIVGMPTLLVLNSEGIELYRSVGLIEPAQLSSILTGLIQK
jgi:thiol:disulfide interchange protein DsbD